MTLVSASNGGNGTMSTFNNIISLTDTLSIGNKTLGAASTTTQFAMLFGQSSSHVTLIEVEFDSGSYIYKGGADNGKTFEFSALKAAKDNGDFTEVSSASFMPQNVITLSAGSPITFDHDGAGGTPDAQLAAGKSYIMLPQSNGSWSFKEATYNSTETSWQLVNGGASLNDVSTNYVFGASALTVTHATTSVTVTIPSEGSGTYMPEGGGHTHYEVRSLYTGTTSNITGVKAKVIKVEYDIWGNKTTTDVTSTLGNEGLTLTLEKDGSAIPDGNSDGTWEYTPDSVGSYDGEDLAFVLKRDSDSQEVGGMGYVLPLRMINTGLNIKELNTGQCINTYYK